MPRATFEGLTVRFCSDDCETPVNGVEWHPAVPRRANPAYPPRQFRGEYSGSDDAEGRSDQGGLAVLSQHRRPAGNAASVHEPNLSFVGGGVVPEDIGLAVPIEVARPDDAEGRSDEGGFAVLSQHRRPAGHAVIAVRTVHEPDLSFVGRAVVPQEIRDRIFIEIIGSDDPPGRSDEGGLAVLSQHRRPAGHASAVHDPDGSRRSRCGARGSRPSRSEFVRWLRRC